MNKLLISFLSLSILSTQASAQRIREVDEAMKNGTMAADTSKHGRWKKGGTIALNLAQQTSSYWAGTSEKFSLNLGTSAALYANEEHGKVKWDNTLKASYAISNTHSLGTRKGADFFDLFSKYGYALNDKKSLFLALIGNVRSQFSDGYDYSQEPKRRVSDFFAPAHILVTPGIDYHPTKSFTLFLSPVAARWVVIAGDAYSYSFPNGVKPDGTKQKPLASLYGVDPEKKVDGQFGALLSANFNKEIFKNVNYSSRLDLYSDYLDQPKNVDIFWTNGLGLKVNKWLTVTYQWNIAYDDNYTPDGEKGPRTQFLGNLGIGVSGNF